MRCWIHTIVCALLAGPTVALAASIPACPEYPILQDDVHHISGKLTLSGIVKFLTGIGAEGDYQTTAKSVVTQFQDNSALIMEMYLYIPSCELILSDPSLTNLQKVAALRDAARDAVTILRPYIPENHTETESIAVKTYLVDYRPVQADLNPASIRDAIQARQAWQREWFLLNSDGSIRGAPHSYHVIVASPKGKADAQKTMTNFTQRYPQVAFQLWKTNSNDYYAVTVGIGLSHGQAKQLAAQVSRLGMKGAYIWRGN